MSTRSLEKELHTYQAKLSELLSNEGKFALVSGDELGGVYETYEDALKIGYEKYGLKSFLVKQISAVEQVGYLTRDMLTQCHT